MVTARIEQFFEGIVETIREPLLVLNSDLRVILASRSFYEFFKVTPEETVGQLIYDLGNGQWNIPRLRELLEKILPHNNPFDNYEVEHDFAAIGMRTMLLNARQLKSKMGREMIILLAMEDITERIQLETLLKNSEEQYRRLFETADDGILLLEKNRLKIRHANPAITAMLGYSNEEVLGKEMKDIGLPDSVGTFQEIMQKLNKDGILHCKDIKVQQKAGQFIYTDIYMANRANLVQCNIRVISERKEIEAKFFETRDYLDTLFNYANAPIVVWDPEGNIIRFNCAFEYLTGYKEGEVLGKSLQMLFPEKSQEESLIKIKSSSTGEYWKLEEIPILCKDGQVKTALWSSANIYADDGSTLLSSIAQGMDITDRICEQEKLQTSEAFNKTIIEASRDCIKTLDMEGRLEFMNKGGQELMEIKDITPYLNHSWFDFWKGSDHTAALEAFVKAQEVNSGKFEGYCPTEKGTPKWWNVIITPIHIKEGKTDRFLAVSRDITERKEKEKEQRNLEAQFQQAQKMESVGRLAGGVAHDFNNALSVIMGFTELAMYKADSNSPLHANFEEILKAAKRATIVTRQLLAFARKQTIAPKVLDINKTLEGMLKMLQHLIGENINLVWLPGVRLWNIKMDPSQIDQILANLCVNARDAIRGVGTVTVETSTVVFDEEYCVHHPGFIPGKFVMLEVSDNGCGMDKEILEHLFEPFFTTKEVYKGTGLGLATVYGILKQNNGFINVYSEPGHGTTIKIYLPGIDEKPAQIEKKTREDIPQGDGETVLVVEDDLTILKLTQKILDDLGYNVLTACTPNEAIQLTKDNAGKINLLVTDLIMPEMNGSELANQLKSLYPDLKLVFMSGYTADIISHQGIPDHGVCFIQKPFSRESLAITVRQSLDGTNGSIYD